MPPGSPRSFLAELKRRKVYRVAAMYAAVAFVVWQVSDILVNTLDLPEWVMIAVVVGSILVFPFAVLLAWAYELTPDGVRRTTDGDDGQDPATGTSPATERAAGVMQGSRLRRAGIVVAAAAVLATGGWWAVGIRAAPADRNAMTLAVFPFTVRGSDGLAYLREGLVDLLSRNLSGALELHPLDPSLMLKVTGGSEPEDVLAAGDIARSVGAGQFVTGSVSEAAGRLRIDATLFVLGDSVRTLATSSVQGDTTQLFELIDRLTAELLAGRSTGAASDRLVRTAAMTTSSLPALKAYLEGEQHYRNGKHEDAADAFQRALAEDSTFVLARYRLAISYHMRFEHDAAHREIARVLDEAARLGVHDRRVAEAFLAYHAGDVSTAEHQLRAIIAEYPSDLEARVILAELQISYAAARAEPLTEAKRLLEEVLAADPQFACIYCALSAAAAAEGDLVSLERVLRLSNGSETGDSMSLSDSDAFFYASARGDTAGLRTAAERLDSVTDGHLWGHLAMEAVSHGYAAAAEHAMEKMRTLGDTPASVHLWQAQLALAQGAWGLAAAQIDSLGRVQDAVDRAAFHALMTVPVELRIPTLEALRDRLLNWRDGRVSASQLAEQWPIELQPAIRCYLLGLLDARMGDTGSALAWADSLVRRADSETTYAQLVRSLAQTVRADVALRAGQPQVAVRELAQVHMTPPPALLAPWVSAPAYATLLRPQAHRAAGEHEEALRWLRRGVALYGSPPPGLYAVWHRDMAYTLDALGRTDEARAHYARFIAAWEHADPELQPQVEAARARLAAIAAEH